MTSITVGYIRNLLATFINTTFEFTFFTSKDLSAPHTAHVKNDLSSFLKVHFSHTQGISSAFVSLLGYVDSLSSL